MVKNFEGHNLRIRQSFDQWMACGYLQNTSKMHFWKRNFSEKWPRFLFLVHFVHTHTNKIKTFTNDSKENAL